MRSDLPDATLAAGSSDREKVSKTGAGVEHLTNEELNHLIATEVMGWEIERDDFGIITGDFIPRQSFDLDNYSPTTDRNQSGEALERALQLIEQLPDDALDGIELPETYYFKHRTARQECELALKIVRALKTNQQGETK